jgi:hypothetical protein
MLLLGASYFDAEEGGLVGFEVAACELIGFKFVICASAASASALSEGEHFIKPFFAYTPSSSSSSSSLLLPSAGEWCFSVCSILYEVSTLCEVIISLLSPISFERIPGSPMLFGLFVST